MKPTLRDQEIVQTLAGQLRVMSVVQVSRCWWTDTPWGKRRCKQTLEELAVEEMVTLRRVLTRPVAPLTCSLEQWHPANTPPNFEALSRTLHQRAQQSARMTDIVFAAPHAVCLFGNRRPTIKLTQMTHDLSVAEVYLHYRRLGQREAWRSEDQLGSDWPLRIKPDAVLVDDVGEIVCAIEYGGDYSAARLAEIHEGMAAIELGYEIW